MSQALINLRDFENPSDTRYEYRYKSSKYPAFSNSNLKFFLAHSTHVIQQLEPSSHQSNLTYTQRMALRQLQTRQDIAVNPSDKGGNLVIQTIERYITMCLRILLHTEWYCKISLFMILDY